MTQIDSGRSEGDSWDLASSVGTTATMIAAGRAMATKDPRGLIDDPFADQLVRGVGLDFFVKMIDGELDLSAIENASPERVQAMIDGIAVRTRFFDEYLLNATATGVRQAVILASGLDSRRRPRCSASAPSPPLRDAPSASTCAQTGRRNYGRPVWMPARRRRGWPKVC